MATTSRRPQRHGLGRFFGNRPTKPDARAIFNYWRDTVANLPDDGVNHVTNVDTRTTYNRLIHCTNEYKDGLFVVRRGQLFDIDIELTREYQQDKDDLRMVFQFGTNPQIINDTEVEVLLADEAGYKGWNATVISADGTSIKVQVTTPPVCYVGKWTMFIDSVKVDGKSVSVERYNHEPKVYVIFNPWCTGDTVYLEEDDKRKEYVLNESGCIYVGSQWPFPRDWSFGQFEDVVLDCALYLLDEKSEMMDHVRGNPVNVARKISALVNSSDDGGILIGNWSGDYEGGTKPTEWPGSVRILEEYYGSKEPVKYGQCWVFSGVVTTICRALGIPARSTTNFSSAHDTDNTITIDRYIDEDGQPIEYMNRDSVWNFHVWNDVWMKRPDLPDGYDGWQAIDATPQETSDGTYCMGPMSLKAIKEGNLTQPYDGKFVYAEVNGDRVTYKRQKGEKEGTIKYVISKIDTHAVGRFISTKKVLKYERDDITDEYKHQEWGRRNKEAAERAHIHAEKHDDQPHDCKFTVHLPSETYVGEPIVIKLSLKNGANEVRHINGNVLVSSIFYTGIVKRHIISFPYDGVAFAPGEVKELAHEIRADQYFEHLTDFCSVRIACYLHAKETGQSMSYETDINLAKPALNIKAVSECVVGESVRVETSFANPLDMTLTRCKLSIEGPGLQRALVIPQKNVPANGTFVGEFYIHPIKAGDRQLVVVFNADQLYSVDNHHSIKVKEME